MFLFTITVCLLFASAFSRPEAPAPVPAAQGSSTPIAIVSQTEETNPDGSFKFSYETANGIKVEENGYLKDGNESSTDKIQVIQGSVSYTDSDGKVISLKYIADENGFQPEGDHIPTVPPSLEGAARSAKALPVEPAAAAAPAPPAIIAPAPQPVTPEAQPEPKPAEETTETAKPASS